MYVNDDRAEAFVKNVIEICCVNSSFSLDQYLRNAKSMQIPIAIIATSPNTRIIIFNCTLFLDICFSIIFLKEL
tara:strand:- start:238 stop:459 length:222 start_codon:yes stop_codon:yes gene_type:complete